MRNLAEERENVTNLQDLLKSPKTQVLQVKMIV